MVDTLDAVGLLSLALYMIGGTVLRPPYAISTTALRRVHYCPTPIPFCSGTDLPCTVLRTCSAVSATGLREDAMHVDLRCWYAMFGTKVRYAPTPGSLFLYENQAASEAQVPAHLYCAGMMLRACYAISGTGVTKGAVALYAPATRCPVLRSHMGLPDYRGYPACDHSYHVSAPL
eukprot:1218191-Rhodomonas_salina.3